MRVLIVYHAGAVQSARRIYRALAKSDNMELTVVVPEKLKVDRVYGSGGWIRAEREEDLDGYRLVPVPLRNPLIYQHGFESERVHQIMRQVQADIIHVLDEPRSGYLFQVVWQRAVALRRSKVLFYGFENLPIRFSLRSRLKWRTTWTQLAGGAAANNEVLENLRRAGFPRNRPLERIFWGIPTDIFKPVGRRSDLRKELDLDCEHVVGFVGRLAPEKGLVALLAATRRLPPAVHCVIIGSGPMQPELELWSALPDLNKRIHLYDVMEPERLVKYMNCMDVLAVPSLTTHYWKEQYGRVIPEAMACGVPVVGSDSGAIPEVIGSAGAIVPEGDVAALAEALQTIISDHALRTSLVEHGLRRAEDELSVQAMSRGLAAFYDRILGG